MAQLAWVALTVGLIVLLLIELNYRLHKRARPMEDLAEIYRAVESRLLRNEKRVRISFVGYAPWFLVGQRENKKGVVLYLPRVGYSVEEYQDVISAFERHCYYVKHHDDDSRFVATVAIQPVSSAQPNSVLVVRGAKIFMESLGIPSTAKFRWIFDY